MCEEKLRYPGKESINFDQMQTVVKRMSYVSRPILMVAYKNIL